MILYGKENIRTMKEYYKQWQYGGTYKTINFHRNYPMIDGIQKQWNLWNSDGLFFNIVKNANYDGKHHQMIENPNNWWNVIGYKTVEISIKN